MSELLWVLDLWLAGLYLQHLTWSTEPTNVRRSHALSLNLWAPFLMRRSDTWMSLAHPRPLHPTLPCSQWKDAPPSLSLTGTKQTMRPEVDRTFVYCLCWLKLVTVLKELMDNLRNEWEKLQCPIRQLLERKLKEPTAFLMDVKSVFYLWNVH